MPDAMDEAKEAAEQVRTWTARRDEAIRRARGSHSLGEIASATGLSKAGVDKIARS